LSRFFGLEDKFGESSSRLTETPYYVVADHQHKKIVIAIRGTLSLEDTLTDLAARPVPMSVEDPELEGMEAHGGMLKAARDEIHLLRGIVL
jgi:sn1-specific diacylglycerol lipase